MSFLPILLRVLGEAYPIRKEIKVKKKVKNTIIWGFIN